VTLLTSNVRDFGRLREVERFEFEAPYPMGGPET
jgi:hypothetical protein